MIPVLQRASILVLGIGNILLRDEGAGVRVVECLRAESLPSDIEVVDGGTAGADLLDLICDRHKLVVIDTMLDEAEPGTIRRFTIDDLAAQADHRLSLHEVGLLDTLEMARLLGAEPEEVVIFGIQPERIEPGDQLTPTVQAQIPRVVSLVRAECARVGTNRIRAVTGGLA